MFFRNLTLYRFPADIAAEVAEGLAAGLAEQSLRPCGPLELSTTGFVSPLGRQSDVLSHSIGDFTLIALGTEAKILPSSVVNEYLAEEIAEVSEREGRRVGARERKRMKEGVLTKLLTQAFIRTTRVFAYIDHAQHWVVVDGARRHAEEVISGIREALGRFPATPMAPDESPRALMTDWLVRNALPEGFAFGDECELRDPAEAGSIIRARRQDLESEEVREHLKSGKQVFQLGLEFEERMAFVLGEDLTIRKLRFLDIVLDELGDDASESAAAELDARFALMTLELRRLLARLSEIFGIGEVPAMRLDPPPTPKSMRAAATNPELLGALAKLAPKPGSGIDSVTISSPGSGQEPVTLTADSGKRLSQLADLARRLREALPTFSEKQLSELVEVLPRAARSVRASGRVSISGLQREFVTGYNAAARMVEALELLQVVSRPDAAGKRTVLPV